MTNNSLEVTFVLPVYNEQNNIAQCINSLLDQEFRAEVIVINDASTDYTTDIIAHYQKHLVVFHNEERMGAAWCRNLGNSKATGDIIAVCDAEYYYKDRSKAIVEFFKEYKDISIFSSALHCRDAITSEKWLQPSFEWDFKSKCPISHPTVAYRREVAKKVKYHEDSKDTDLFEFFLLDAHKKGYKFGYCDNPLLSKVEGNSNRDKTAAKELKKQKYKEYGIEI